MQQRLTGCWPRHCALRLLCSAGRAMCRAHQGCGPVLGRRAQVCGHRLARRHDGELLQGLPVTWRQRGGEDVVVRGAGAQAVHVRAGAVGRRRRHRPHHKALALQRRLVHIGLPRTLRICGGCARLQYSRRAPDASAQSHGVLEAMSRYWKTKWTQPCSAPVTRAVLDDLLPARHDYWHTCGVDAHSSSCATIGCPT